MTQERDDEIKTLREEHSRLLADHAAMRKRGEERSRKLESQLKKVQATTTEMERKVERVSAHSLLL